MKRCDKDGVCEAMKDRLQTGREKGFCSLTINDMQTGGSYFAGVFYRKNSIDRGLMLNACPFCLGVPGKTANENMAPQPYSIVIEPTEDPLFFGVYIPDLPGCTTTATSLSAAVVEASVSIEEHVALLTEMGKPIPPATWEKSD